MTVAVLEKPQVNLKDGLSLGRYLHQRFGPAVQRDAWGGIVVDADRLREVVGFMKDDPALQTDYLASVTSVDYEDRFEVVYHLASVANQEGPVTLKVHADKADPVVPSLTSLYAGADFQEREIWDLMGIRFAGHPNLKRILLWEGFEGHPMRKDWLEAYYEEERKPFKSRWPEIRNTRAEDQVPWRHNVRYPAGWNPAEWAPPGEEPMVDIEDLQDGRRPRSDRFVINMGPQHPSTHGVFQMRITLDGETVVDLQPVMGYLHRNHEKIGERNMYLMNMPYTDRLDYLSAMANNMAYAIAVEKLAGMEVPERAEYIRVIMAELTRIANHGFVVGQFVSDLGAFHTPMLWGLTAREHILDLFEAAAGSRMMCNYARFGGVFRDLPEGWLEACRQVVYESIPRLIDDLDDLITRNEIVRARAEGVGIVPPEVAINYSLSGPMLRASGVPYDLRKADPYSIYDRFEFDLAVYPNGDVYDRYRVRLEEMRQSVRILKQALRDIPEGPVQSGKPKWMFRVAPGEVYGRAENPKGELGFFLVADGTANPYRYHVRSPAFVNLTALGEMCKGHKVADVVAIFSAIDIVLGEVDR